MLYLFIKLIIFFKHKIKISFISASQFCRSGNKCLFTTLKYKVSSLSYFINKNMGRRDDSVQNLITERGYENKKTSKTKIKTTVPVTVMCLYLCARQRKAVDVRAILSEHWVQLPNISYLSILIISIPFLFINTCLRKKVIENNRRK